jgi:tRNA guanosine-2'-O-methyltransferase
MHIAIKSMTQKVIDSVEPIEAIIPDVPDIPKSVQRKISPCTSNRETANPKEGIFEIEETRRNSIIIIASLITKAANIGGLTRTCEVFNAGLIVIDNVKATQDPSFLATSVSSEIWMPIKEVKRESLEDYLLELRQEGIKLVAVEQATNSILLGSFKFPEKCAVILGDEKQGIPANILDLVDYVIEIPQFGNTRSLNVHVSGSLLLWEYVYQTHGSAN